MASFRQFAKSTSKTLRQYWYIHGDAVLADYTRETAVAHLTERFGEFERVVMFGDTLDYTELEAVVVSGHLPVLVILHNAEAADMAEVVRIVGSKHVGLIAMSSDARKPEGEWLDFFKKPKARFVTCSPPEFEDLRVLTSGLEMAWDAESLLLRGSRGDAGWLWNQVRKLRTLQAPIGNQHVEVLCSGFGHPRVEEDFRKELEGKRSALLRMDAKGLTREDYATILSDTLLIASATALSASIDMAGVTQVAASLRIPAKKAEEIWPYKEGYINHFTKQRLRVMVDLKKGMEAGNNLAWCAAITRW